MNDCNAIVIEGRVLHVEGDTTGITGLWLASVHESPTKTGKTTRVSRTETYVTVLMDKYHMDKSFLDGNPRIRVTGRLEMYNKCVCIRPEYIGLKPTAPREE